MKNLPFEGHVVQNPSGFSIINHVTSENTIFFIGWDNITF